MERSREGGEAETGAVAAVADGDDGVEEEDGPHGAAVSGTGRLRHKGKQMRARTTEGVK